tara:strand:- start:490 stop:690 length:201 start_codon:yes stop_codon:yes gene_type:complete
MSKEQAMRVLAWSFDQKGKSGEILEEWRDWQIGGIDDQELIRRIGEILFRDYPRERVEIKDAPKPN